MDRRRFLAATALGASQLALGRFAFGQEPVELPRLSGLPNVVSPTTGGKQFWRDEMFFHRWRIQRNAFTHHCRLLDGDDFRHAWGTFSECQAKLDQIKRENDLPPMKGTGVVVLHGLMGNAGHMSKLCGYLDKIDSYTIFNVTYPTTRGALADHARGLASILDHLDGIDKIHFVAHSMGNLVIRHCLADMASDRSRPRPDPRFQRMVMLGPPNQGAQLAEVAGKSKVVKWVAGKATSQMGRDWPGLEAELATPDFEFAIIAGGRGGDRGFNPFLTGDNDLVIDVERTKLPGASDFVVLPVRHPLMMNDVTVQEYTARFLQHGYLIAEDRRHPLLKAGA